ncbi:MAG: 4a-hydroxytetrahydrobiopterin dehydratase [Candidatus Eisenbacteria bacterium]|nr:4a-hydroxytetrahydrobiopterin dehydratase [Candidatus Eisenbacteria bacterium]
MSEKWTPEQVGEALASLPRFRFDGEALVGEWEFPNFAGAIRFVLDVAAVAERSNHHPDIDVRYTRVRLRLWTHSAGGVTAKDLDLARSLDALR